MKFCDYCTIQSYAEEISIHLNDMKVNSLNFDDDEGDYIDDRPQDGRKKP